jgi:transposase
MATERLTMQQIREILRQKWGIGRSHREVARSLTLSPGSVANAIERAAAAGLDLAAVSALSDAELDAKLYAERAKKGEARPLPDPLYLHDEYQRVGVTLELLHQEYIEQHPGGYRYTQFCAIYRDWLLKRRLSMKQVHKGGERMFVDYSGKRPHIVSYLTGEQTPVELFISVLGASSYTFAEATMSQQVPDFIASHVRAFAYFEGVAGALVPDQLKSAVTKACRYEPTLHHTYVELAEHYGTAILPARPRKPKDKAKVEVAVQVAQRWILARLRNETFYTLAELNKRIRELLDDLNNRKMKGYGGQTRRERFLKVDKPALKPLPEEAFVLAERKWVKPNIDYHVDLGDHHYYSVPHTLRDEKLLARFSQTTVEIFHHGERVASHKRSFEVGRHTTTPEHMPKAHREHLEWSPTRIISWGQSIGPSTAALLEAIMAERKHPEQGYRSCLGILRQEKAYDKVRLEAACERALFNRARSYKHVESILRRGLDRMPLPKAPGATAPANIEPHENIRGAAYYSDDAASNTKEESNVE